MKTKNANETAKPIISVDLIEAAKRSDTFPRDWSPERLHRALARYERFLLLVAANPGVAVSPTRDIDEMWHLHMLSPRAYYEDCSRLFGEVLDHDGGFGKEPVEVPLLQATFERTARLWEEQFGEPYLDALVETREGATVDCWHDCQSRCWHACSSKSASTSVAQ